MSSKALIVTLIAGSAAMFAGCGGAPAGNANASNANSPVGTSQPKVEEPSNPAPTLSPAVKAYCDAWAKNDEAALRKVYSTDTLEQFAGEMKEAKEKSLMKFLQDDKISGTPCEVTNEEITGDTATVRLKADKYPKGIRLVYVKENGEWKLTNRVPEVDSVKKNAANAK